MASDVISLSCACGKTLKVKSTALGKKVRCPECKESVLVAQPQSTTNRPESQSSVKPSDDPAETGSAPGDPFAFLKPVDSASAATSIAPIVVADKKPVAKSQSKTTAKTTAKSKAKAKTKTPQAPVQPAVKAAVDQSHPIAANQAAAVSQPVVQSPQPSQAAGADSEKLDEVVDFTIANPKPSMPQPIATSASANPLIANPSIASSARESTAEAAPESAVDADNPYAATANPVSASGGQAYDGGQGNSYPMLNLIRRIYKGLAILVMLASLLMGIAMMGAILSQGESIWLAIFTGIWTFGMGATMGVTMLAASEGIKLMLDIQANTYRAANRP
ncbi:hypothetical protein Pla22_28140 [Rubripirellula amarantea]|uniref:Uncharacterized protein n=1 Tax=Rubripirellula amarantea TaxID=2527999 RepID=A0A5C5WY10_9BACT|nr:hypothetical protein [Rubripirellula amarantea]TWT55159.1 hypothetical protein Pla22_28140 [Rubripirellula amarantea]